MVTLAAIGEKKNKTCNDIPADAASDIIAISLSPSINDFFSVIFSVSIVELISSHLCVYRAPPDSFRIILPLRPVISATSLGPPSLSIMSSSGFMGRSNFSISSRRIALPEGTLLSSSSSSAAVAAASPAPLDSGSRKKKTAEDQ